LSGTPDFLASFIDSIFSNSYQNFVSGHPFLDLIITLVTTSRGIEAIGREAVKTLISTVASAFSGFIVIP